MSQRRQSDSSVENWEIVKHQGRRFRKSSTSSALFGVTENISRPQPSPPSHHSPNTSFLSRSILLPPPKQPTLTEKGRPYSATRRVRPRSIASLNPADEYRLQFALKHSQPLPPIEDNHQFSSNDSSPTLYLKEPNKHTPQLYEVDSAVDLEYSSQCGTPIDVVSSVPTNAHLISQYTGDTGSVSSNDHQVQTTVCVSEENVLQSSNSTVTSNISDAMKGMKLNEQYQHSNHELHARLNANRPTSASENSNRLSNVSKTVILGLKLPNGDRLQVELPLTTTLWDVVSCAEYHSGMELRECELFTNEIPRRIFDDKTLTLFDVGITVRTIIHFSSL